MISQVSNLDMPPAAERNSPRTAHSLTSIRPRLPRIAFCPEKERLSRDFVDSVHELFELQNQQTQALISGDSDFTRFDVLLHFAQEMKDQAKYAWMAHVEQHHCDEDDTNDEADPS